MSVAPTQAAKVMEENASTLSAHQVISLLLAGAMERIAQAKASIRNGKDSEKMIFIAKLIGIINGLRQSLNMDQGGDIAVNLDNLYLYITNRLESCESTEEMQVLNEVGKLLDQVRDGWDAIGSDVA